MVMITRNELREGETLQDGYMRKLREHQEANTEAIASSPFAGMSDDESLAYQTQEWVKGNSFHNPIRDECCPDFSCCGGTLMDETARHAFVNALPVDRHKMLRGVLQATVSDKGGYVPDPDTGTTSH